MYILEQRSALSKIDLPFSFFFFFYNFTFLYFSLHCCSGSFSGSFPILLSSKMHKSTRAVAGFTNEGMTFLALSWACSFGASAMDLDVKLKKYIYIYI